MAYTSDVSDSSVISKAVNSGDVLNIYNTGEAYNTNVNGGSVNVYENGNVTSTTLSNSGSLNVFSGGSAYDTTLLSGTYMSVHDGIESYAFNTVATGATIFVNGKIISTTLNDDAQLYVYETGIASNTTVNNNANLAASEDCQVYDTIINSGGNMDVYNNGNATNTSVNVGANLSIFQSGNAKDTIINGGIATVFDNGTVSGTTINNGGIMTVSSSGKSYDTTVNNGGFLSVLNSGVIYNTAVNSGGFLKIDSGGSLKGTVAIDDGGSAFIWRDTGGSVNLLGNNTQLVITGLNNGGNLTTVIDNFTGNSPGNSDSIVLDGVNPADVTNVAYVDANGNASQDYVTLTLKNGSKITMNIIGAEAAGYNLSSNNGQLVYEVCFLTGTLIRNLFNSEVKVEDLRIGAAIMTYDWKNQQEVTKKVKWVGYKHITVNSSTPYDDAASYPVRILKNAIADNVPHKDLLVTPEHCLFFDNQFVPARMLVNNHSIFYDRSITEYTYYHIETEEHSVIWADGMLTETYLDTGNRNIFKQYKENTVLYSASSLAKNWDNDSCAPLSTDRSFVEPLFDKLLNRAKQIGLEKYNKDIVINKNPELHLRTECGLVIYPHSIQKERLIFAVPKNIFSIYLASKASRPSDTIGAFLDDRRELGVLIGDVTLLTSKQTYNIDNHLTATQLQGWYNVENAPYRWTNGYALLPLEENKETNQSNINNILVVQVVSGGPYIQ